MKFIAYYTENTLYQEEVKHLITSMEFFELSYRIFPKKNLGSWQKNTLILKPEVIEEALKEEQEPICYIDADAQFVRYPELLFSLDCDFAAVLVKWRDFNLYLGVPPIELLGGLLYFNQTEAAKKLLAKWKEINQEYPEHMEQDNLQKALFDLKDEVRFQPLPYAYSTIQDLMVTVLKPVIIHFRAASRLRQSIDSPEHEN